MWEHLKTEQKNSLIDKKVPMVASTETLLFYSWRADYTKKTGKQFDECRNFGKGCIHRCSKFLTKWWLLYESEVGLKIWDEKKWVDKLENIKPWLPSSVPKNAALLDEVFVNVLQANTCSPQDLLPLSLICSHNNKKFQHDSIWKEGQEALLRKTTNHSQGIAGLRMRHTIIIL